MTVNCTKSDHSRVVGPLAALDEDRVFDEAYEAAETALYSGAENAFALSDDELAFACPAEEDDADDEQSDDKIADDDEIGAVDDVQDDEAPDGPGEEECERCGGSGFEPGGDGAQCDACDGEGVVIRSY